MQAPDSLPDKRLAFAEGLGLKLRMSEERSSYPNCALNRDLPGIVVDGALQSLRVDRRLLSTESGDGEKENPGSCCVSRCNVPFSALNPSRPLYGIALAASDTGKLVRASSGKV